MEENKDFQTTSDENSSNSEKSLDELVNSIPENVNINQATTVSDNDDEKPKFDGYKTNTLLFHFLCVFGVVFLSIFFAFNVYLTPITVVGQSMLPTINASTTSNTDTEHTDMVYFRAKEDYTYGDVVIISNETENYIHNTGNSGKVEFLIKRVIACPGDTITFFLTDVDYVHHFYYYDIEVKNSKGQVIDLNEENYIYEPMYIINDNPLSIPTYKNFFDKIAPNILNNSLGIDNRKSTITISKDCYFVMGDNRNNSSDSRFFGEIKKSDICGSVRIQVKYGENIWTALFKKLKSYLSVSYNYLKENLWKKIYSNHLSYFCFCQSWF